MMGAMSNCLFRESFGPCKMTYIQGGGTPIGTVLRAATAVKTKIKSQAEIFTIINSQATVTTVKCQHTTLKYTIVFVKKRELILIIYAVLRYNDGRKRE